jgi:hypothetical protein
MVTALSVFYDLPLSDDEPLHDENAVRSYTLMDPIEDDMVVAIKIHNGAVNFNLGSVFENVEIVEFGENTESIHVDFFWGAEKLKRVYSTNGIIKNGVVDLRHVQLNPLSQRMFKDCRSLHTAYMPRGFRRINKLIQDSNFRHIHIDEPVIRTDWFQSNDTLDTISLGPTVHTIQSKSFYRCDGLTTVIVQSPQLSIEEYAFGECADLTTVECDPDAITTIENFAFYRCSKLSTIGQKKGIVDIGATEIGTSAFTSCESITMVHLRRVQTLNTSAFIHCWRLKAVWFKGDDNTLESIPEYCFSGCANLKYINMPNTVTIIQSDAFGGCKQLEHIPMSTSLKIIRFSAFLHCNKLKHVYLPKDCDYTEATFPENTTVTELADLTEINHELEANAKRSVDADRYNFIDVFRSKFGSGMNVEIEEWVTKLYGKSVFTSNRIMSLPTTYITKSL